MSLMKTYNYFPNKIISGKGNYLIDEDGNKYLDFLSGISVNSLGYNYLPLNKVIKNQISKIIHCSNYFKSEPQIELSKLLIKNSCLDDVFFCNSGAEANDGAIKLARKYNKLNKDKKNIITFKNSFHGRTIATLSATGQGNLHKDFTPLLDGFDYAELNNIHSVEKLINNKTCAIIIEPIQGEGGINIVELGFAKKLSYLCKKNDILLIIDEIQTGLGRTGSLFAYEWLKIEPDILTLAKSLGCGLPLGAILAKRNISNSFRLGDHGSTFGGNPVACAAGSFLIEKILSNKFLDKINKKSIYFERCLLKLKNKYSFILNKKGKGLLLGLQLSLDCSDIVRDLYKKRIIINKVKNNTLRFLPPLTISKHEIDILLHELDIIFNERSKKYGVKNQ